MKSNLIGIVGHLNRKVISQAIDALLNQGRDQISMPEEAQMAKAKVNGKVTKAENIVKVNGKGKAKADFKAQAEAKAKAHQVKRLEFIGKFGKVLAAAWAKMEHPSSMGVWRAVFPKAEEPCRLVDYTLLALGIRQSKDEGLLAWVKADALIGSAACPPAKARKAPKVISKAKLRKDLGEAMSEGQVNV